MIWHSSKIEEVKRELGTNEQNGLSAAEVVGRIQLYGENRHNKQNDKNIFSKVLGKLSNVLTVIMLIVSAILLVTGIISDSADWYVPLIILLVLGINISAELFTEHRIEQELSALKGNDSPSARVRRDGEVTEVDAVMLVPGDIVLLEQGDYIPADGRLVDSYSLICDESAVSGDSAPQEKQAEFITEDICPLYDRKNMAYAGCSVIYGHGTMIVTETGMNTELGRQAAIIEQTEGTELPIHKRLKTIGRAVSYGVMAAAVIIFFIGLICGPSADESFSHLVLNMLLTACAVALAALPETLPKSVNAAYGLGVRRLLKRKIVVKNLQAIEKLAGTSVIISDKTGTLTKNRMQMSTLYDGNAIMDLSYDELNENALTIIRTGALCCNATVSIGTGGKQRYAGDPTEAGIVAACIKYCGMSKDDIENIYPRMAEVPFDSDRKLMTTINMINNRPFAVVKGAPDILIQRCTGGNLKGAAEATAEMGERGLRVIAVAIKPLDEVPSNPNPDNMECELTLLGLFGMSDTISLETRNALKESELAGIRTVMITGDHITTAKASAKSLGILKDGEIAITGEQLQKMSDEELAEQIKSISVYSRISTKDKLRIVTAWQALGEVVALTGDSVDDSAALKTADIGCAMGVTGTDIAKGSADILLTEDSYISIVGAVLESKGIYANIKRIAAFLLSSNLGEVIVMLLGLIIFGASPLTALALLCLNLITDFAPALALGAEPVGDSVKSAKSNLKRRAFFNGSYGISILWQGALMGALGLIAFALGNAQSLQVGSAMALASMILSQSVLAFSLRSEDSIFKAGLINNKYMLTSFGISILFTLLVVATPVRTAFGLGAIAGGMGWHTLWLALMPLVITEAVKWARFLIKK